MLTDDHPMVLSGLQNALKGIEGIHLSGTYSSGYDLLAALEKGAPDILLLDIQMPHLNGAQIAQQVLSTFPGVKIIILSAQEEPYLIQEMLTLGCSGYLLKSHTDSDLLVEAIEAVYAGDTFLEAGLKKLLMASVARTQKKSAQAAAMLTKKEKEILGHIVNGLSSKKIADILDIGIRTVETHRFSLLQKLDVKNTAELVKKTLELHLLM
jgi:DNA-binding NarL/FixJ family response regulator